ncbi:disintegrin and metalloproteinase domain-containing protein 10 homolog [Haemaphysalis longicornis]
MDPASIPHGSGMHKIFRLQLVKDRSAFSDDFTLVTTRGPVRASLDHLYSGHVEGAPGSRVVGAIIDGVFSGRISMGPEGDEFYVERASRFHSPASWPASSRPLGPSFHSFIYSARDVSFDGTGCGLHGAARDTLDAVRKRYARPRGRSQRVRREDRGSRWLRETHASLAPPPKSSGVATDGSDSSDINASSKRANSGRRSRRPRQLGLSVRRVCNLEISVDHTLFEVTLADMNGDTTRAHAAITGLVATHVNAASGIFSRTNFNGITDIAFAVQRLQVNDSSACTLPSKLSNPFCSDALDATLALLELSKVNHDNFCASYLLTHRNFPGGTLGLAYVAEPNGNAGGICEKFQSDLGVHASADYVGRVSLNTGVVTFVNNNVRLPARVSEVTFTHELGHSFGAQVNSPCVCP